MGGVQRTRVVIPYEPRAAFMPLHLRRQRWGIMVCHRRAGKTVSSVNELNRAAITCTKQDGRFAYIAPLFVQAKDIAWNYAKRYAAPIPGVQFNESELRIDYPNQARVRLYGADNADRLRGGYLDGVILDEFDDMAPWVWGEVIRPMLADRQGWALFLGTPKGRGKLFKMLEEAKQEPETWFHLILKASESGLLPQEELGAAKKEMTPEQYEQEFECSFDAAIMGAYYGREMAEADRAGRIGEVEIDPALPLQAAWDLGIDDPTSIWVFQVAKDGLRVIDYYENNGQPAPSHYLSELQARGYKIATHWLPHDAKAKELTTGRTRVEVFRSMIGKDAELHLVPSHTVIDGINALRVSFPRIWWDAAKCKDGLQALRHYRADYDDKARVFSTRPKHDWASHAADAARYMGIAWRELAPDPKPKPATSATGAWVAKPLANGQVAYDVDIKAILAERRRKRLDA